MNTKVRKYLALLLVAVLGLQACAGSKSKCGCENDLNRKYHSRR